VPARLARDLEARQERGVGERLVEIVEGRRERREHLRTGQGNLRVDAAELSRHRAAEPGLVEDRVFGKVTEKVRSGVELAAAARQLTTEESMPPLRKAPTARPPPGARVRRP